jgi:hypothetical protein
VWPTCGAGRSFQSATSSSVKTPRVSVHSQSQIRLNAQILRIFELHSKKKKGERKNQTLCLSTVRLNSKNRQTQQSSTKTMRISLTNSVTLNPLGTLVFLEKILANCRYREFGCKITSCSEKSDSRGPVADGACIHMPDSPNFAR